MATTDPQVPPLATPRGGFFARRLTRRTVTLALLALATLGGSYWRYRITRPAYRLARGQEAVRARDWDVVVAYANRLEDTGHPDEAHLLRGEALLVRQQPDLALGELNKISAGGPHSVQAVALSGRCLLALGDLRGAYGALTFVLSEQPDHVDAHRGLAAIAYDLGQLGTAVDHLERVCELDSLDARPARFMGLIYKDMGQNAQAEAAYREALRRGVADADADEVRRELAEVLIQEAKYAEGLEVLGAGAPDGAEPPDRAAARAECLRGLRRRDEAIETLDRALGRHQTAALYRLRGQLDTDQGRPADAVRNFERAAEKAPADHQIRYLLAQAYAAVGRKEDATRELLRLDEIRKDLDKITALSRKAMAEPWDPAVRLELAEVSERLDKPQLAAVWRKAAAICAGRTR